MPSKKERIRALEGWREDHTSGEQWTKHGNAEKRLAKLEKATVENETRLGRVPKVREGDLDAARRWRDQAWAAHKCLVRGGHDWRVKVAQGGGDWVAVSLTPSPGGICGWVQAAAEVKFTCTVCSYTYKVSAKDLTSQERAIARKAMAAVLGPGKAKK